ncbi:hypothetical protein [Luteimicrobium album]|uniref:hypothetical protein n=1 Tax=Luteimicrobium album TaxID=1054550 RepID=UPI0024E0A063|nr:hypothetical protein [Luteimicrobium album]
MATDAPSRSGLADRAVDLASIAIASLVTVTQALRPSPRDAVLFGLVALTLSVDLARAPAPADAAPPDPRPRRPVVAPRTWGVVGVLGLGRPLGTTPPAVSDVLDPWLDHPGPRGLFVLAWLVGLGYLLRRGRR